MRQKERKLYQTSFKTDGSAALQLQHMLLNKNIKKMRFKPSSDIYLPEATKLNQTEHHKLF